MKSKLRMVLLAAGFAACATPNPWNNDDALGCESIEMQVDQKGAPTEIEVLR